MKKTNLKNLSRKTKLHTLNQIEKTQIPSFAGHRASSEPNKASKRVESLFLQQQALLRSSKIQSFCKNDRNNTDRSLFETFLKKSDKIQIIKVEGAHFNQNVKGWENNKSGECSSHRSDILLLKPSLSLQLNNVLQKGVPVFHKWGGGPGWLRGTPLNRILKGYLKPMDKQNITVLAKQYDLKESQLKYKLAIDIGSQLTTLSYRRFTLEQKQILQVRKIYNEYSGKKTHIFNFLKTLCKYIISPGAMGDNNMVVSEGSGFSPCHKSKAYFKRLNLRLRKILYFSPNKEKLKTNDIIKKKQTTKSALNATGNSDLLKLLLLSRQKEFTWGHSKLFNLKGVDDTQENKNVVPTKNKDLGARTGVPRNKGLLLTSLFRRPKKKAKYQVNKKSEDKKKADDVAWGHQSGSKGIPTNDREGGEPNEKLENKKVLEYKNQDQLNLYSYLHNIFSNKLPYYKNFNNLKDQFECATEIRDHKKKTYNKLSSGSNEPSLSLFNPVLTLRYTDINKNLMGPVAYMSMYAFSNEKKKLAVSQAHENFYLINLPKTGRGETVNMSIQHRGDNEGKYPWNEIKSKLLVQGPASERQPETKKNEAKKNLTLKNDEKKYKDNGHSSVQTEEFMKKGTYIPITLLITLLNRIVHKKSIEFIFKTNHIYSSVFHLKHFWLYLYNHFYPCANLTLSENLWKKHKNIILNKKAQDKTKINIKTNNKETYKLKQGQFSFNYEKTLQKAKDNKKDNTPDILNMLLINKQIDLDHNNLSKKVLSSNLYIQHLKLKYYSKITNISRIERIGSKIKNNERKEAYTYTRNALSKGKPTPLSFNKNQNGFTDQATLKEGVLKGGYTKRLIAFSNEKKKRIGVTYNTIPLKNKHSNIKSGSRNTTINVDSNKLNQLRTDIALYNTLNLINLTF